jgi:arabinose-5-phosphate isomerase
MITREDVLIAISNSGESDELLTVVPLIKRQGGRLIAITGNPNPPWPARPTPTSTPASSRRPARSTWPPPPAPPRRWPWATPWRWPCWMRAASAPRTSPARTPAAPSGRRLLTHVRDVMRGIEAVPCVGEQASIAEALLAITRGGMGMTAVVTPARGVAGIFTDGDLRRALQRNVDLKGTPVAEVMTRNPRVIGPERLAAETAQMMEEYKISQILVVDKGALIGALNTHDLFRAKVI